MDDLSLGQLAQQIKWMEDERRKDKAQIATLQERLAGQAREIAEACAPPARDGQQPQGDASHAGAPAQHRSRAGRIQDRYRRDDQSAGRRPQEVRARNRAHPQSLDRNACSARSTKSKSKCRASARSKKNCPTAAPKRSAWRELVQRLQPQIDAAAQLVEERTRGVPYLEEGRRQDVKRLLVVEQETHQPSEETRLAGGQTASAGRCAGQDSAALRAARRAPQRSRQAAGRSALRRFPPAAAGEVL